MEPVFVATSRFVIVNGMAEAVKAAFRDRPQLVDEAAGFIRMEVLSPQDAPNEIWLLTYWRDRESYHAWHSGPAHKASHAFMPVGLKLDRTRTEIRYWDHVCD